MSDQSDQLENNLDYYSETNQNSSLLEEEKESNSSSEINEELLEKDLSHKPHQTWEKISTKRGIKSLSQLNKNLGLVAQKLANQSELNGLLVTGLITNTINQAIAPILEQKIDKQTAGASVIRRLSEIVPDRFVGESREPFLWQASVIGGKTYQFEIEGGDLIQENNQTKLTPKQIKAIDLVSQQQVFQATSLDNRSWQIKQCDFNVTQLEALSHAQNLLDKSIENNPMTKSNSQSEIEK